jgi:hypothetical protein
MAQRCILIRGYKIDIEKYYEVHGEIVPNDAEDFIPFPGHKILVVQRADDSNDFNDYGFYLTEEIFDFGESITFDDEDLRIFLNNDLRTISADNRYCSEYGFFQDMYDMDERFVFLTHEDF